MPGYFTDFGNNKVLDLIFGSAPYTPPATLYLGLSQVPANKAGTVIEPSVGGYARVGVSNNLANFPAAVVSTKANSAVVTFPAPSAAWGTIVSLFVADAAAGGNVIAMADLTTPKAINVGGSPATVAAGALFFSHT